MVGQKLWTVVPAGVVTGKYLKSFKEYPPSQRVGSFNADAMYQKLMKFLEKRGQ